MLSSAAANPVVPAEETSASTRCVGGRASRQPADRSGLSGRTSRRGFGLAELLVAFAILIPVLVVTTGMFPYVHLVNNRARNIAQAALLAQAETERLRTLSETALVDSTRTVTGDRVEFTVATRILPTTGARLKRAEVDVTWSDQRYRVVTLIEVAP